MPQLDFLIFFNEMFYTLLGFIVFYVLLYRLVIVKLAYNLKLRAKLKNKLDLGQTVNGSNIFAGSKDVFKQFESLTSYLEFITYRENKLVNSLKNQIKEYIKKNRRKIK